MTRRARCWGLAFVAALFVFPPGCALDTAGLDQHTATIPATSDGPTDATDGPVAPPPDAAADKAGVPHGDAAPADTGSDASSCEACARRGGTCSGGKCVFH